MVGGHGMALLGYSTHTVSNWGKVFMQDIWGRQPKDIIRIGHSGNHKIFFFWSHYSHWLGEFVFSELGLDLGG
jgi:hypothetical protein